MMTSPISPSRMVAQPMKAHQSHTSEIVSHANDAGDHSVKDNVSNGFSFDKFYVQGVSPAVKVLTKITVIEFVEILSIIRGHVNVSMN